MMAIEKNEKKKKGWKGWIIKGVLIASLLSLGVAPHVSEPVAEALSIAIESMIDGGE